MAKASQQRISMNKPGYLVFETGGTKLVAGVAGADCRLIETEVLYRQSGDRAEKSLRRLIETARKLRSKHESAGDASGGRESPNLDFQACGFGFGGYVRRSTRRPLACLHEEGWEETDAARIIEQEFGLPVAVENDCKLGALAEAHFGAGRGHRAVFYITIGTGIGGGIVRDGRIQQMSDTGEAEIGHIVVLPGGPPCCCGNRGCVESVCSGPGITQLAALVAGDSDKLWRESSLSAGEPGNPAPSSKDLLAAWGHGDLFAAEVIRRAANYLGSAIASAMNLLSPDIFVVGGGLGSASLPLLKQIADSARPLVAPCFRDRLQLVRAELGEGAVTHGAALLAASIEPPPERPTQSQRDTGS